MTDSRRRPTVGAFIVDSRKDLKIGILGGIGWPATMHYYTELCRRYEALDLADASQIPTMPEMCIESLSLRRAVAWLGADNDESSWHRFDDYHRAGLRRLQTSGAEIALMASNTPHHRYSAIVAGVDIPVLNMFEAVARRCRSEGHTEVLILGTALTMRSQVLRDTFKAQGIHAYAPATSESRATVLRSISDLQRGHNEGTAQCIRALVHETIPSHGDRAPVVCLACTELPLAFTEQNNCAVFNSAGISYINSSVVHIEAAIGFARDEI